MNCQQQRVNLVVCASRGLVTVTAHGVVCKRLIPKEGKKFKTAALELAAVLSPTSCSSSTIEFVTGRLVQNYVIGCFSTTVANLDSSTHTNDEQSLELNVGLAKININLKLMQISLQKIINQKQSFLPHDDMHSVDMLSQDVHTKRYGNIPAEASRLFDAECPRNGTRNIHSYNEIKGTYTRPTQGCHFELP